jgi:hypothetical protein
VYGYDATDEADPWKVRDVTGTPGYVNDLHFLEFGQGYWISVTQPITLYLKGGSGSTVSTEAAASGAQSPPATYYGKVLDGDGFTPAPGMVVAAWVDGNACGQGETLEVGGEVVYSVNVFADGSRQAAGCGAPGRVVTFEVSSQVMVSTAVWDNDRLWEVALRATCYWADLDCDGDVDIGDIQQVASRWRCALGDDCYQSQYDVDGDGAITIVDIMRVAAEWGWSDNGGAGTSGWLSVVGTWAAISCAQYVRRARRDRWWCCSPSGIDPPVSGTCSGS